MGGEGLSVCGAVSVCCTVCSVMGDNRSPYLFWAQFVATCKAMVLTG